MPPLQLDYAVRVRDLVHGFVQLTKTEIDVINHPLFQRLRHIRQNDVAFLVYPSLNISRFEHSLGCAHVAGRMAENLQRSADWSSYAKAVDLGPAEFVQVCRLYALLHDLGHLPLSHLFEHAFEDHVKASRPGISIQEVCKEWFGIEGFAKLHEACGAALATEILASVEPEAVRRAVERLMRTKSLDPADPLRPVKLLVDSEIDADRIDATARDGLLAGQEYGNYDIERLCSAVFVQGRGPTWRLAYSHKALGSIEGLLLDRCRTHTWIHFHHRVVSTKAAARFLLASLFRAERIGPRDFPVSDHHEMALRDDVWLWGTLREHARALFSSGSADPAVEACIRALLYRDNSGVIPLWKNRTEYQDTIEPLLSELRKKALADEINPRMFGRPYEEWLSNTLGISTVVFWLNFKPFAKNALTPLTNERGSDDQGHLLNNSALVSGLSQMWEREAGFHVVLLGGARDKRDASRSKWAEATVEWIRRAS